MKRRMFIFAAMMFSTMLSSCLWMHALAYQWTHREDRIYGLIYGNRLKELEEYVKEHPESLRDVHTPHFLSGGSRTTPLRSAILSGRVEAARILIEHGAPLDLLGIDPRAYLKYQIDVLERERKYLRQEVAENPKMLLTPRQKKLLADSEPKAITKKRAMLEYVTPIYDAYYKGVEKDPVWVCLKKRDAKGLKRCLSEGGEKNLARGEGEMPLAFAYRNLDMRCVRVLQEVHAEVGRVWIPNHCIAMAEDLKTALLHHRLSDPRNRSLINVRGKDGESPFTRAVLRGLTPRELRIWLENGADPNARDAQGRAIEECLGEKSRTEKLERLQSSAKQYLERRRKDEEVELFWRDEGRAYRIPDKRTKGIPTDPAVSELKKRWKLRYDADSERYMELRDERKKIWEEFLRRHPEFRLDSRGEDGETLLNAAIRAYDYRATELLLSLGADPRVTDADGSCPAEDMIECARLAESWKDWTTPSELFYGGEMIRVGGPLMAPWRQKQAKFGKEEYIVYGLGATKSALALKNALDTGIISEDYADSKGRTIDEIVGTIPDGRDPFHREAALRILQNCR